MGVKKPHQVLLLYQIITSTTSKFGVGSLEQCSSGWLEISYLK